MEHQENEIAITTERLILRMFQLSDAHTVTELCNNIHIYENTLYLPYPYSLDDALSWIKTHHGNFKDDKLFEFAIMNKKTKELVGAIALSNNQNFHQGELAYWIGEKYWGNGYATEACDALLKFAFLEKGYHKVWARYFLSNNASGRVIEKLGLEKEGILKDHVKKDDRYEDLVYCGMIHSQYRK
ncbi:GNAT family N-acetyltransferase [Evansella cellulosilytica]|uniref:GCN5-related N-acetyltransferase n=1 Tax=Evansella cellulosilytica (strain ATCC 21833 / DSM 2522 / FERM P-1141 / JCM 9156 / N-4) TaxID=649639 RepID=E6U0R7_EVAC2|nr:GNAT family N-acetyltransferase [Evansella cellulosilytica]ADU29115.1 GCN5-related N-acetyltransferase [Evansella cellulosilytica DSM 2522]